MQLNVVFREKLKLTKTEIDRSEFYIINVLKYCKWCKVFLLSLYVSFLPSNFYFVLFSHSKIKTVSSSGDLCSNLSDKVINKGTLDFKI